MKKIIFSAVMAVAAMGAANATDYVVYSGLDALGEGQVQIPYTDILTWNNENIQGVADETFDGRSVYQFGYNQGQWSFCGYGWLIDLANFDCSVLKNEETVLKFYAKTNNPNANWYTKATMTAANGGEKAHEIQIYPTTEWQEFTVKMATDAPNTYAILDQELTAAYSFTVVGKNNTSGDYIQVTNVRYEVPDVAAPQLKVSVDVSDVTYNSAVLKYNVTHKNLTGDLKVELLSNGEHVADLDADETSYTLTGLTEKTEYTYAVHAYSTADQLTTSEAITFTTKSENFEPQTWHQNYVSEVNYGGLTYHVNADCSFTTTEEGAIKVHAKVVGGEDLINAGGYKFHCIVNGISEFMPLTKVGDFEYEATTSEITGVEEGTSTMMETYFEYPGNSVHDAYYNYKYGDSNADTFTLQPIITAFGYEDLTSNSVTLKYTVANASEFDSVEVLAGENALTSAEIDGLAAGTAYTYNLTAVGTLNGATYTGNTAEVSFTTLSEDEKEAKWYFQIENGELPNAYLPGESYDDNARTLYYNALLTLTYFGGKITAEFAVSGTGAKAVGFWPQIHIGTEYLQPTKTAGDVDVYSYTLPGTYAVGDEMPSPFEMHMAYDRQAFQVTIEDYTAGASNDNPASGVTSIAADATTNAPVEYFNLQGVRVNGNLAPGVYIRRQGQATSKVLVK
jgi:hypothetical protein